MRISADFSALARTRWYEYLSRFLFGGVMTALAGLIAKKYGPTLGGLFLAFPAIFPASATLIEKHEKKKQQARGHGVLRGRKAAALDAAGATMGSLGLLTFAFLVWRLIEEIPTPGSVNCLVQVFADVEQRSLSGPDSDASSSAESSSCHSLVHY